MIALGPALAWPLRMAFCVYCVASFFEVGSADPAKLATAVAAVVVVCAGAACYACAPCGAPPQLAGFKVA